MQSRNVTWYVAIMSLTALVVPVWTTPDWLPC